MVSQVVLMVRNPPANAGDLRNTGSIPGSGRSPGEGHCNPLQCSCLENPMDRGAWWATVHGVAQSQRRLTNFWISRNSGGASVSQGCRNKVPQTWWLAQQKCIILQFWRQEVYVLGASRKTEGKSYRVQVD